MSIYPSATIVAPSRINVERLNAEFLDTFVFLGQYPVHTIVPRDNIKLPVGIIVSEDASRLGMAGLGYYAQVNTNGDPPTAGFGSLADGVVNIDIVAEHPDLRDSILAETLAAYFSEEGRCWFFNQPDIDVHGYNIIATAKSNYDRSLDGKISYLYTVRISIRFLYDIIATKQYGKLDTIKVYQIIVPNVILNAG